MAVALDRDRPQDLLSSLVVADVSPIRGKISPEFQNYADGMIQLEKMRVKSRKEAFDILAEYEQVNELDMPGLIFGLTVYVPGYFSPTIPTDESCHNSTAISFEIQSTA